MRRSVLRAGLAAFLAALAGCAEYEAKPVSSETLAQEFDSRRTDDPGLSSFIAKVRPDLGAMPAWNAERLTLAAWWFNSDLRVARAQWSVAEAGVITAGGRPNPTLSVLPGYNFDARNVASPWLPVLNVDIPIETAGKRDRRIDRARCLADAARCNLAGVAWKIRSSVRVAMAGMRDAKARQNSLATLLAARERLLAMQEQRADGGFISRSELLVFRLAAQQAKADLADAGAAGIEAECRLAEAVGIPVDSLKKLTLEPLRDVMPPPEFASREARGRALRDRSDIRAALADHAANEAGLRLEIAKQYPDIHLSSNYQWDQGESKWQFGLVADIPMFNRNQGPIAEAGARRDESAARLAALQDRIIADCTRTLGVLNAAERRLAEVDATLKIRDGQVAAADGQLAAGESEPIDALAAKIEFLSAQVLRLDALALRRTALSALEDVTESSFENGVTYPGETWEHPAPADPSIRS